MKLLVRRPFPWLIALLCILLMPLATQAQEKSLVWDRFDVNILVNRDGTFDVAEHQTIRFTEGEFTFGYRNIPVSYFNYIDDWTITDSSGNRDEQVNGGGTP